MKMGSSSAIPLVSKKKKINESEACCHYCELQAFHFPERKLWMRRRPSTDYLNRFLTGRSVTDVEQSLLREVNNKNCACIFSISAKVEV
jgi:hypothetical protein